MVSIQSCLLLRGGERLSARLRQAKRFRPEVLLQLPYPVLAVGSTVVDGFRPEAEPKEIDVLDRIAGPVRIALKQVQHGQMLPGARLVDKSFHQRHATKGRHRLDGLPLHEPGLNNRYGLNEADKRQPLISHDTAVQRTGGDRAAITHMAKKIGRCNFRCKRPTMLSELAATCYGFTGLAPSLKQ